MRTFKIKINGYPTAKIPFSLKKNVFYHSLRLIFYTQIKIKNCVAWYDLLFIYWNNYYIGERGVIHLRFEGIQKAQFLPKIINHVYKRNYNDQK